MTDEPQERRKSRSRLALPDGVKSVCRRLLVPVCAMVAGGLGLAALLGWVLGLPFPAGLGPEKIPMAPSTAMLLALYGMTIFLRSRLPRRVTYWTGLSVHATGALIALFLVILSYQGIHPEAEHLGISILHTPGLAPTGQGHMSPVTALCFLLASLSFGIPGQALAGVRRLAARLPPAGDKLPAGPGVSVWHAAPLPRIPHLALIAEQPGLLGPRRRAGRPCLAACPAVSPAG
ncbi:MAG: hypothetical protein MUO63_05505 [Desulfobulbaceae bacterium]|nr:hypothetical protein [Desulfobulbaceae bacterium]